MQTEKHTYVFHLHILGPGVDQEMPLSPGAYIIGREEGSAIRLADAYISRRHAQLTVGTVECVLEDLGSHNGTGVDGQQLQPNAPVILHPPAVIQIGPFVLTLTQQEIARPDPGASLPVFIEDEQSTPDSRGAPENQAEDDNQPEAEDPSEADIQPEVDSQPIHEEQPEAELQLEAAATPEEMGEPGSAGGDGSAGGKVAAAGEDPAFAPAFRGPGLPFPPGLTRDSLRLIKYLPGIYQTEFMSHFLALFEAILMPVEWNVDNFDLYCSPETAPDSFLPWLANWFEIAADPAWDDEQRRAILKEAAALYARRGTRWAMSRVLEILTGQPPEIVEFEDGQPPLIVTIRVRLGDRKVDPQFLQRLVLASQPAHVQCRLVAA